MSIGKNAVAIKFLHMLVTPFESTSAYAHGVIDKDGNVLKTPGTVEEQNSYTLLEKLVFSLKRLIEKAPGGKSKIASMAAAYWLVKESGEDYDIPLIERRLQKFIDSNVSFIEEEIEIQKLVEEIAANNTAGAEVSNPDAIPKKKKTVKDLLARRVK